MTARGLTSAVIFGAAALLVGYDLWALATPAPDDTLSEVMRDWGPASAFATGWLAGHFFVPLPRVLPSWAGLAAGAVLWAFSVVALASFPRPMDAVLALVIGALGGAVLWPLEPKR